MNYDNRYKNKNDTDYSIWYSSLFVHWKNCYEESYLFDDCKLYRHDCACSREKNRALTFNAARDRKRWRQTCPPGTIQQRTGGVSPHNFNAFAVYKRVGNTMMIDISSPGDEREDASRRSVQRLRERERLLGRRMAKGARRRGGSSQKHRDWDRVASFLSGRRCTSANCA